MVPNTWKSWKAWGSQANTDKKPQKINWTQRKQKLNPQESPESRHKFVKRFHWTDTLLREIEKQAFQDILVDYHDIFARHRMDIGINTEFKEKLTPKDD